MSVTNNVDLKTQPHQSFLELETQAISKQVDKLLEKVDERNFKKILDQILLMVAYQARLICGSNEELVQSIVASTRKNIDDQVALYGGKHGTKMAWGHAVSSLVIQGVATAVGFGGNSGASTGLSYFGKAFDSGYEAYKEGIQGQRTAFEFEGKELQRLQGDSKEDRQKNGERTGTAAQTAGQVNSSAHDIFSKLTQ